MRIWNFWINTLILSIEYHQPRFVELLQQFAIKSSTKIDI